MVPPPFSTLWTCRCHGLSAIDESPLFVAGAFLGHPHAFGTRRLGGMTFMLAGRCAGFSYTT